ncbi:6,7-dimethyl-8-ribityllumazine synthase [Phaeodactylibacter luteus]|uniref:6,7-dimethyl-8-ribityllumazine synthase n=1 Tax=Phaeodactylibacter luteus TaxID=1564516 RepID=A0A5C6RXM1_9BACT|nr:6,7-dimethyl-8-ribityllumazine synthase [Phaeodactylibacter luteus]TXB66579.1 6,7-dimethyl-8-ribityllumazine synthase [Phaeodactylibacter luteus]
MASALKNLSDYDERSLKDAAGFSFGIVVADWNAHITHALYEGCFDTLAKHGVPDSQIHTLQVPGAFELTAGAKMLAEKHKLDAVICLGCVIKGETTHNEYINYAVANGLTNLSMVYGKPFIFGVLTPNNEEQALDRAGGKHGNKGVEAAVTAIRMAALREGLKGDKPSIGFSA